MRIDPGTNAVAATVTLPGAPYSATRTSSAGRSGCPQIRQNSIAVVDPATNAVVRTVKAGVGPFVVTQIAGEAWVPSWKGHDIWRFSAG